MHRRHAGEEQRLRNHDAAAVVVAAERRQVQALQQRMVDGPVAERRVPAVPARVHVDGRHPEVRRLEQRQPVHGHAFGRVRHAAHAALARPARLPAVAQVGPFRIHGRQLYQRRIHAGGDVEEPGLGVVRPTWPIGPADDAGQNQGAVERRRREERAVVEPPQLLQRTPPQLRREIDQILLGCALQVERLRPCRKRLGRRRPLAGHGRSRHGALLDRPDRLAGGAVEDVGECLLAGLDDRLYRAAVDGDVGEHRRGGEVVVPQSVVHRLEMPYPPAGPGFEADEALGEQVVARPRAAVVVVRRRRGGQVDIIEFRVVRHTGPDVGVSGVLGRAAQPRLVARFELPWDGEEGPQPAPRADVESVYGAGRHLPVDGAVRDGAADDRHVAGDQWPSRRHASAVAARPRHTHEQVDPPAVAERRVRLSGTRVQRDEMRVDGADQHPLGGPVGPVAQSALYEADRPRPAAGVALGVVHPARRAGRRIECGDQTKAGNGVQHAVHHQRRVLVAAGAPERVRPLQLAVGGLPAPRHAQVADVVCRDLVERGIAREGGVAAPGAPLFA